MPIMVLILASRNENQGKSEKEDKSSLEEHDEESGAFEYPSRTTYCIRVRGVFYRLKIWCLKPMCSRRTPRGMVYRCANSLGKSVQRFI
jgi:hypothetical protein